MRKIIKAGKVLKIKSEHLERFKKIREVVFLTDHSKSVLTMLSFTLNFFYTAIGFLVGVLSFPQEISFRKNPYAVVMKVRYFWCGIGYMRRARAMTIGHTILLSRKTEPRDLEHELAHIRQFEKFPLIFPVLYYIELFKNGYRNNKYEDEAYRIAGNVYKEK